MTNEECSHDRSKSVSVFYCSLCEDEQHRRKEADAKEAPALREQVRTLTAANAVMLEVVRDLPVFFGKVSAALAQYGISATLEPSPEAKAILATQHPGAALLAEMDGLRRQVETLTAERDSLQTHLQEANATKGDMLKGADTLRAQAERAEMVLGEVATTLGFSGHPDGMVTFASTLRARVAELEAERDRWIEAAPLTPDESTPEDAERNIQRIVEARHMAERERDDARAALATARDAALEEAAQVSEAAEAKTPGMRVGLHIVAGRIRALKAQPARRFVEAERVARTLAKWLADLKSVNPEFNDPESHALLSDVGIDADEVKP